MDRERLWRRASKLSMRDFIRKHRAEIDAAIDAALNRKPASAYGR